MKSVLRHDLAVFSCAVHFRRLHRHRTAPPDRLLVVSLAKLRARHVVSSARSSFGILASRRLCVGPMPITPFPLRSYIVLALPCLRHLPNCVGGAFLINCAAVFQWGARRQEAGDGGRSVTVSLTASLLKSW